MSESDTKPSTESKETSQTTSAEATRAASSVDQASSASADASQAEESKSGTQIPENADAANPVPEDPIEALLKQINSLQLELQSSREDVIRVRAEMDNFRKRAQRDKDELRKTAAANLIEDLLPVLDNMKLGLQAAEQHPEAKVVADGFQMVFSALKTTLADNGLKELSPLNEAFDPNFHDCVSQQPSETVEADKVIQVVRAGYVLGDRMLRPATVVVSSGKPDAKASEVAEEAATK